MNRSSMSVFTTGLTAAALVVATSGALAQGYGQTMTSSTVTVTGRPDLFRGSPGTNVGIPSAFGASMGDFFIGGEYQERIRTTKAPNGAWLTDNGIDIGTISAGFGLGDANDIIGFTTVATAVSIARPGNGNNATFSFQASHNVDHSLALAVGVINALSTSGNAGSGGESWYGVATKVFDAPLKSATWLKSLTVTAGIGDGRFRLIDDIATGNKTVMGFGSVELRVHEMLAVGAEFSGQDLNIWVPITPLKWCPVTITPGIVDVTGTGNKAARFVINGGLGIHF